MRPVLIDIAEFMESPIRSGIQRVVRELVMNWPKDVPVRYVRFDARKNGFRHVSKASLARAVAYEPERHGAFKSTGHDATHEVDLAPGDIVLVPEVFYEHSRVQFYRNLVARGEILAHFIVYDFVPWLQPSMIGLGARSSPTIMPYLMLLTEVPHRCFISTTVKADFADRILRRNPGSAGPVIPLGSDGINIERQAFSPMRTDLLCIGTLDGKKRQDIVFDAFCGLEPGRRGRLVCLGRIHPRPAPWMHALLNTKLTDVIVIDSPSEALVAERLRSARATAFVSTAEGFGLPAVESLRCGIPVVAHAGLPCLAGLPDGGQIRLPEVTVEAVAAALDTLSSDDELRRLWSEAARLDLPSWRDYAASVATWATEARERLSP